MFYFEWFFNVFQLQTIYNYINYDTYLVVFYVGCFIVVLVILDIAYVAYGFKQKKLKHMWTLKFLRSVCNYFVTIFFFNFLGKAEVSN